MGIEGERLGLPALWAVAAWGLIAAVLSAPVAAALVGVVYRFPIPFGDHAQGVGEAGNAAMASVFYLVKGEGFVLAALGGGAGYGIARAVGPGLLRALTLAVLAAFGLALLAALVLAVL
ncbi:hypothetical protein [Nocardia brasiliensis]|uniref:hypothetical protein n=1 Tax=Nocardia brasiliensis TaxID=37326 RepID=UPI0004A7829F|nr:hypothetical protein [Nocardia brasiliensis]MBF6541629.1 hypothetical protein [Nocardia brasiliensis]